VEETPVPPVAFIAPEAMFELKFGIRSDDWALICVVYMIRTSKALFNVRWGLGGLGGQGEAVWGIANTLEPLPEKWDNMPFDEEGMPRQGKMSYEL
jgi:hypothetical protein